MLLPFGSTENRDHVFADLAASNKPRRAIALYGLASLVLISCLGFGWLGLSQFLSANYGLELRSTFSASSHGGVSLPNFQGVLAGLVWLGIWLVGMAQIRKLALFIGQHTGPVA
jgi:hypothetical protein